MYLNKLYSLQIKNAVMNNFEMNMYLNNEVHGTRRKYTNTFIKRLSQTFMSISFLTMSN